MDCKLSIIIPVYNVCEYVSKCLESCVNQNVSSDEYEIIVVNDGSTDKSLDILMDYQSKYSIIKVLSQNNQGLSMARNRGLDAAKGEYVWFVDSDDWIEHNCINFIINKLEEYRPDMLQVGFRLVYDISEKNKDSNRGFFEGCFSGIEIMKKEIIPSPAQLTICKREFLLTNNLRFYPNIYHEDVEFKPRALYFAEKFCSLNRIVYNYYQREKDSITSTFSLKRGKDLITVANSLLYFKNDNVTDQAISKEFNLLSTMAINRMLRGLRALPKEQQDELISILEKNKDTSSMMLGSKWMTHKVEGLLCLVNTRLMCRLYTFMSFLNE